MKRKIGVVFEPNEEQLKVQRPQIPKAQRDFQAQRILALGRSGVGKTYSVIKYVTALAKQGIWDPERIVLMSKTWRSDPSQKELIDFCESKYKGWKQGNAFESVDVKFISDLFNSQKIVKETDPEFLQQWVVILDDQISDKIISSKDPALINAFTVGRHFNISMVVMLQRFRGTMNVTMRDQFTKLAIFMQGNKKALLDLLADYDESPQSHKEGLAFMYSCYRDATEAEEGHGCLVINTLVQHGQGRLQKGLLGTHFYDKLSTLLPKVALPRIKEQDEYQSQSDEDQA